MKILLVNTFFPAYRGDESGGGGTVVVLQIARALKDRGHQVHVFAGNNDPAKKDLASEDYSLEGIKVRRINLRLSRDISRIDNFYHPLVNEAFKEFLLAVDPDVVHYHALQGLGVSPVSLAKSFGFPVCVTMHDWYWVCPYLFLTKANGLLCSSSSLVDYAKCDCLDNGFLAKRRDFLSLVSQGVDLFLTPSAYARQSFIQNGFVTEERIKVNSNGIELGAYQATSRPPDRRERVRFLYIGGMNKVKGYHILLKAYAGLPRRLKKRATLVMYGMFPPRRRSATPAAAETPQSSRWIWLLAKFNKLRREPVSALKIAFRAGLFFAKAAGRRITVLLSRLYWARYQGVDLRPPFNEKDKSAIFADCDVVLAPSITRETFHLVTREAFLMGKPVIATYSGGPEEIIKDGHNGLLVESANVEQLRGALASVIEEPGLIDKLRANVNTDMIITVDEQAKELEKVYGRLKKLKRALKPALEADGRVVIERQKVINDHLHTYVERSDGFGFYLDQACLVLWRGEASEDCRQFLERFFHLTPEDVATMTQALVSVRLLRPNNPAPDGTHQEGQAEDE